MIGMLITIIVSSVISILVSNWMLNNPETTDKIANSIFKVFSRIFKGKKKDG